jgi:hypothetical protein
MPSIHSLLLTTTLTLAPALAHCAEDNLQARPEISYAGFTAHRGAAFAIVRIMNNSVKAICVQDREVPGPDGKGPQAFFGFTDRKGASVKYKGVRAYLPQPETRYYVIPPRVEVEFKYLLTGQYALELGDEYHTNISILTVNCSVLDGGYLFSDVLSPEDWRKRTRLPVADPDSGERFVLTTGDLTFSLPIREKAKD